MKEKRGDPCTPQILRFAAMVDEAEIRKHWATGEKADWTGGAARKWLQRFCGRQNIQKLSPALRPTELRPGEVRALIREGRGICRRPGACFVLQSQAACPLLL